MNSIDIASYDKPLPAPAEPPPAKAAYDQLYDVPPSKRVVDWPRIARLVRAKQRRAPT